MPTDPTTTAALGVEPTYSAQEAADMLGRSYSWLDQRLRAGQFVLPGGATVTPLRTSGGYRRFTLQMLRDIIVARTRQDWFSVEDTRCALHAVITASYRETGEFQVPSRRALNDPESGLLGWPHRSASPQPVRSRASGSLSQPAHPTL
jgi:hypothetical protein